MAKETFYFSHDYNARSDRKMISLLMSCGIEGIGIYWCVVEMLYEEGGYLMHSECERIAFELRTHCDIVDKVLKSTLFSRDEEKFWSESVLHRIQKRQHIIEGASKAATIRWENEKRMRAHSDGNAIKVKQSKIKNNKEDYNKVNACIYKSESELENAAADVIKKISNEFDSFHGIKSGKIADIAKTIKDKYFKKQPINDLKSLAKTFLELDLSRFPNDYINGKDVFSKL